MTIQNDKLLHFVISLIIAIVLALAVKGAEITQPGILCGIYAAVVTMFIGLGKEIWDHFRGTGFCWKDLLADFAGCLLAVIFTIFM